MIFFNSEIEFSMIDIEDTKEWISNCISDEYKSEGEINYIFCDDDSLLKKNIKYLNHNTLTDIISFDYTIGDLLSGDIFVSVERVKENAELFKTNFENELHRVMIHGVLHFCGYKDKSETEKSLMRSKEDYYLSLRTFKKN